MIFILTWNKDKWDESNIMSMMERFSAGEKVSSTWKCGSHQKINIGDRFFLSRTGKESPGLIGSGKIISDPRKGPDFENPEKNSWFVGIEFDYLTNSPETVVISHKELAEKLDVEASEFTPRMSGTPYRSSNLELEKLWKKLTSNDGFIYLGEADVIKGEHEGDKTTVPINEFKNHIVINSSNIPKPFMSREFLNYKIKRIVDKNPRTGSDANNCSGYNIWKLCRDNITVAEYQNIIESNFDKADSQFDKTKHLKYDIVHKWVILVPPFHSDNSIADDIKEITSNSSLDETEKSRLVSARIGQGQYRKSLIDYWGGCTVTGYSDSAILVASHIKPWALSSNHERLDMYNGLLLTPNIDKAFDKGYITFSDTGSIIISPLLESPEVIGINSSMTIDILDEHKVYLRFHRDNEYEKFARSERH